MKVYGPPEDDGLTCRSDMALAYGSGHIIIVPGPGPRAVHPHCAEATVMILSFRTDRPGQTVQTQIRLLLEEQSDQGLHSLPFRLHRLDSLVYGKAT